MITSSADDDVFNQTTSLAPYGESNTLTAKIRNGINGMSEKQVSQLTLAGYIIAGLLSLIVAMGGYFIKVNNDRLNAMEQWRIEHTDDVNLRAQVDQLAQQMSEFNRWREEHEEYSRDQVIMLNGQLARISAKLGIQN